MNTNNPSASVFESFNARNLSPQQVAQRFIPPPRHFEDLLLRRHSLVIGPRGSGKTTLLKMLQLQALSVWDHPEADYYRHRIDFTGVFIPADLSWGAQLKALGHDELRPDISQILGLAAFTTHVLLSLVDTMREVTRGNEFKIASVADKYVKVSSAQEDSACRLIASNWKLTPPLYSFYGIKLSLRERLSEISQIARKRNFRAATTVGPDEITEIDFLFLSYLQCVSFAIEVFNDTVSQPERRWALLFDELEIAPQSIRRELLAAIRSADPRILFKLSISPYHEDIDVLESSISAMPSQDYQPIELWYARKEEGYRFSELLLKSMLEEEGLGDASPDDVFGPSFFDAGDYGNDLKRSGYRPGTIMHKRFVSLAARDESFRNYLKDNNVDLNEMHLMSDNHRASVVRKGASVIAIRENFRSSEHQIGAPTRVARSRKTPTIYTGSRSLFAIIEGNPRWFIGVVAPLIKEFKESTRHVHRSSQAKAISTATNRFRALLRTIPYAPPTRGSSARGLLSLLDAIGESLFHTTVLVDYNPDPPLSFIVDSHASTEILDALGKALNAGAIIFAPDQDSDVVISSLRGKRFRLSYMLAPGYGIPLTLGRPLALSQLLQRSKLDADQLSMLNG